MAATDCCGFDAFSVDDGLPCILLLLLLLLLDGC
jgi:hypothetical protein